MRWYRIDRGTARVDVVSREVVDRQASSYYSDCSPDEDLGGRFSTPWAIFVRTDKVSETDRVVFDFPEEAAS